MASERIPILKSITCDIPDSIYQALKERMDSGGTNKDHVVTAALAEYLCKPIHTLFSVSTSAALVEGLYQGAMRVSHLLRHGDFGIETFINLDGEMVVLDGNCYQISSSGAVTVVEGNQLIPYAVVTRFDPEFVKYLCQSRGFSELLSTFNGLRESDNVFYAFRVEGRFSFVKTRVVKEVPEGTRLTAAASVQAEFVFNDLDGTCVGIWSPGFASSFSVPGYHLHFLSADRKQGGHGLDCRTQDVSVSGCAMNEMHVSLPETEEFLKADLTQNPAT